ncbi:hypothetical protein RV11_GL001353 [Enterococcus phoeniculicola]|nr:hypothetical protein RV11_GL001353 [Enterococcus phoeniculicola]
MAEIACFFYFKILLQNSDFLGNFQIISVIFESFFLIKKLNK